MPITKRIQYRYDSVRNKIGMTDADGGLHTYTYDVMRRLTGVINPLGERTTYAYDLNGRRTSVQLANGTRTSYVYDLGSRVQSVHTLKSDDSTVSKFEYEYDGNGRRTSVLEADGSRVTWTYDSISQVTSEWRTGMNPHRHTFTYDSVGNRTLKIEDGARTTLVYDACNQLLTSEDNTGTTTFTYDGNGNQTVVQKPNGDRTTQVWDYENRLIKTIQPSGGVTSMAYDADGLRLKKEDATGTKLFVWDDQNYLAETDAVGTTQAAFTTEPSTYGSLISHRKAGASTTYHFDALGSTRALTDESEAVLERYNYSAFGTLLGSPALLTPFLWGGMVGYYWDAALATQYIRARHYQPAIARWISLDPMEFIDGVNLYLYMSNDTLLSLDPSGMFKISVIPVQGAFGYGKSCGSSSDRGNRAYVHWQYVLEDKAPSVGAPCDGYLVQKMELECGTTPCDDDCGGSCKAKTEKGGYYEAWPVLAGKPTFDVSQVYKNPAEAALIVSTDSTGVSFISDTCGIENSTGEIRFYCKDKKDIPRDKKGKPIGPKIGKNPGDIGTGDLAANGWVTGVAAGPGGSCLAATTSGGLLGMPLTQEPPFWKEVPLGGLPIANIGGGTASRSFKSDWNCCKGQKNFFNAEPKPKPDGWGN